MHTVKINILPGTCLASMGMESANIAQNTVAKGVLIVIVRSVLKRYEWKN